MDVCSVVVVAPADVDTVCCVALERIAEKMIARPRNRKSITANAAAVASQTVVFNAIPVPCNTDTSRRLQPVACVGITVVVADRIARPGYHNSSTGGTRSGAVTPAVIGTGVVGDGGAFMNSNADAGRVLALTIVGCTRVKGEGAVAGNIYSVSTSITGSRIVGAGVMHHQIAIA